MDKNMMDSMKKPVAMESKMAKKSAPKAGLKGNQSKLDANKNGKVDAEDFKIDIMRTNTFIEFSKDE